MTEETYIERLARVDREVEQIRERRAVQALRVTAGYTTDELSAMPDSALSRWYHERAAIDEQLRHTKAKINEQAHYIEQLEKARDFWRQKYNELKATL